MTPLPKRTLEYTRLQSPNTNLHPVTKILSILLSYPSFLFSKKLELNLQVSLLVSKCLHLKHDLGKLSGL